MNETREVHESSCVRCSRSLPICDFYEGDNNCVRWEARFHGYLCRPCLKWCIDYEKQLDWAMERLAGTRLPGRWSNER